MSSKFMKSAAVLGTATFASLLLVACGSKSADKAADTSSSEAQEIRFLPPFAAATHTTIQRLSVLCKPR